MPDTQSNSTIVVTAQSATTWYGTDSASQIYDYFATMVNTLWDIFSQIGGGDAVQTLSMRLVNGRMIIRVPGIDVPFAVANWEQIPEDRRGAIIKVLTEYKDSDELEQSLNHYGAARRA